MSVFWAGDVQRLLEDLVLHRLATEQAFEVTNSLLQIADARRADDVLVGLDRGMSAFQHPALPGKELRRRDARLPRHEGHAHSRPHRLLDEADLLGGRPSPPALHGSDHFNPRKRAIRSFRHSRTHRRMPMPCRLCHLSGQNGVRSSGRTSVTKLQDHRRTGFDRSAFEVVPLCAIKLRSAEPQDLERRRTALEMRAARRLERRTL